jgi:hypothetical protein
MEPTTIIIIGLLLFGGVEHIQKEKAQDEIIELKAELSEAQENTQKAVEVNKTNADTIATIDNSRLQCLRDLKESKARQADYAAINEDRAVRIEELESLVDSYDWSSVRIPAELVREIATD